MKKTLLSAVCALLVFTSGFSQSKSDKNVKTPQSNKEKMVATAGTLTKKQVKKLRKKHEKYLVNSKINKTLYATKLQRANAAVPPNKYYEQEYLLSMNPALGRPTPENLEVISKQLQAERRLALANGRVPGDAASNMWVERGPNNVGGRTKAMIFDPTDTNDADGYTVIAGGVSGGLWKNTNIASAASTWTRISTLPEHLNVQNITVDPNNSSTWYVGTGESYTGDCSGSGIWKTTDAGATWTRVFGGGTVSPTQHTVYNLYITAPSNAAVVRGFATGTANFGSPVASFGSNKQIVLVNDGAAPTDDACSALAAGSLTDKIALIRRGTCTFEAKVLAAENAGAVGVIIMNNVAGGGVIGMADSGLGAAIPSVSISKEDGDLLVANLANLTGDFATALPGEFTGIEMSGIQFINDIAIKNNGGVSEIYAAISDGIDGGAYLNSSNYGLYKSVNGGSTWTLLNLPVSPSGNRTCPMDIEIAVGGKIWVSSTNSRTFGDGGGRVFVSTNNGTTFTTAYTSTHPTTAKVSKRTEIEVSETTADVVYVLAQLDVVIDDANPVIETQIVKTTDGFATTPTVLTDPNTSGFGFTGLAQAFYDLMIETSPTNDAIVYVGGLDIYRSANSGSSWTKISEWTTDVHADQHAMTFKPGNSNIAVFGNDGGVYYSGSLSTTGTPATARVSGFNVTQFVGVAVMPGGVAGTAGDFFVAGAQDNGSNYFPSSRSTSVGAVAGINGSFEVQGGDGGIPLFAQDSDKYYVTNYVFNDNMNSRGLNGTRIKALSDGTANRGLFYPAMVLDSANDIVYSDFTNGTNRVYAVRRYANVKATGTLTRTDLTNALLTSYPTALSVGKATPTTLYIGTANSKVLRLTSANTVTATGAGWSDISVGAGFVGTISDIEFGANDNQIFVTIKNYGTTSVWYTSNGGTNWYSIEGNLPDMPVHTIMQNPLNTAEVMIGTDLGVWYTNTFNPAATGNQALVWKQAYNGMSGVKVTDLDLQPNSPTAPTAYNIYAATYGRGVFSGPLSSAILSVNQNDAVAKSISVFPTISKGAVTITSDKVYGKTQLELFDITGKKVATDNIDLNGNESQVNFGILSAGNYILKLSGDGFETTKRLIIE